MKAMFLKILHGWMGGFGRPGARRADEDPFEHVEVPRYPPLNEGLPPVSIDRLMQTQVDLIRELQDVLSLTPEDFERLILPVIRNMAAFVHLLPASEHHHHNGAGGLFHHSLDVAFRAARLTKDKIFERTATPRVRNRMEPRWRVATGLAGLLHDVGKPQTDVIVVDRSGDLQWQPFQESLFDWARRNGLDRYFPRFVDERHRAHQVMAPVMLDQVITAELRSWLTEYGNGPAAAVVGAITGNGTNHMVTHLVNSADKASVAVDLKKRGAAIDGLGIGIPAHGYVVDAMRRLLAEKKWRVNEPGARVWVLSDGAFVVWNVACKEIIELLRSDNVPGIPGDVDTLADILIERSFAVPRLLDGGIMFRYWPMLPLVLKERGLRRPLLMLRIANPEAIFNQAPPPPVEAIGGEDAEAMLSATVREAEGDEDDEPTLVTLTAGASPVGIIGTGQDEKASSGVASASAPAGSARGEKAVTGASSAPASVTAAAPTRRPQTPTPAAPPVADRPRSAADGEGGAKAAASPAKAKDTSTSDFAGTVRDLEQLWSAETSHGATTSTPVPAPAVDDDDVQHARATLTALGRPGRLLVEMASKAAAGHDASSIFVRKGRRVGVVYPEAFQMFASFESGESARGVMDILKEFEAASAIEPNPTAAGRSVQQLGDRNVVVLKPDYGKAVRTLVPNIDADTPSSARPDQRQKAPVPELTEADRILAEQFHTWASQHAGSTEGVVREQGVLRVRVDGLSAFIGNTPYSLTRVRSVITASGWVHDTANFNFVYYEPGGESGSV